MQIRILAIAGGDNVGQTTRRMMKKLMSDSVALEYNFRGKGSKQSFGALRLKTIVCGMYQKSFKHFYVIWHAHKSGMSLKNTVVYFSQTVKFWLLETSV